MQEETLQGETATLKGASAVSWLQKNAPLLVGTASGLYIIRCLPAIGFRLHVIPLLLTGAILGVLGVFAAVGLLVFLLTTKEPPPSSTEGLSNFGLEGDTSRTRDAEQPVLVSGPGKALSLAGRDVSRPAGQTGGVPGVDMPPHSIMLHGCYSGTIWTIPSSSWKRSDIIGGWPPKTNGAKAVPGMRRWHANLQDNMLHLTILDPTKPGQAGKEDAKGTHLAAADIPLEGCTVTVVTEGLRGKSRWTRKAPLEVSHPSGQLLDGCSSFMLFAVGSAAKEQWFNAITWACQQGGSAAGVEALYSNFCANAYALGLAPYPQLSGEDMTANESLEALRAAREAKAGKGWLGSWRSAKDSKDAEAKAEARAGARAEAKAAKDAKKAEKQAAKARNANLQSSAPPAFVDPQELEQHWMRTRSQRDKAKPPDSPFTVAGSSPGTPPSPLPAGPSLSIRLPPEEAPGQELKAITKSAPASQAASRTSTRPSSPMPIPAQQNNGQVREPEQMLGASPPGSGLSAKSVTFSKSVPKDMAQLPSRPESPAESVVGRLRSHSESAARDSSLPATPVHAGLPQSKAAPLFEPHHVEGHPMKGYPTMLVEHAVNALLARVGFDLLRNPVIKQKIQEKIQAKVNNQRVPDYIQSIKVLDLHLGNNVPTISNLRAMPSPSTTIWPQALFHFDWQGEIEVIVEAKVDVRDAPAWATFEKAMQSLEGTEQAAAVGSEAMHRPADDHAGVSGDSSDDEMDPLQRPTPVSRAEESEAPAAAKAGKEAGKPKMMTKMAGLGLNLRKFATTTVRNLAEATAESINKMQLRVCIDIRSLKGDICAWLPPPPGDRLWYSFLSAPSLELDVKPVMGGRWLQHSSRAGSVSKWIAGKISSSITKNMVFPSCNDLVLPGLLAIDHPQAAARFPAKPAYDTLSAEAKPKVDDKASSKAGSKTEAAAALPEPGASLKYPSDAKAARPALGGLLRLNAHKDAAAQQQPQRTTAAAASPSMIELSSKSAHSLSPGDATPSQIPAAVTAKEPAAGAGIQPAVASKADDEGLQHTTGAPNAPEMPKVDSDAYARMGLATTPTPAGPPSAAAIQESSEPAAPEPASSPASSEAPASEAIEPQHSAPSLISHPGSNPFHGPVDAALDKSGSPATASASQRDMADGAHIQAKTVRRSVSELSAAGQKLPEKASAPEDARPNSARSVAPADLRSSVSQQQHPDGGKREKASLWFKNLEAQHPKWTHQGLKLAEQFSNWRGPGQEQPKSPKPIKPVEL